MNYFDKHFNLLVLIVVSLASAVFLFWEWQTAVLAIEATSTIENNVVFNIEPSRAKPPAQTVKAVYLTAYSAGSAKKLDEIIGLIDKTELNAVVIEIKDYSGLVLYDSQVPLVKKLKLKSNRLGDVVAMIKKLHANSIYVIARQTVFQDPLLAEKKIEWAIKSKSGEVWRDNKNLAWVDPTQQGVWGYNLAIAKEAIRLGFDEINFDYVRFPSDGNMSQVVYTTGDKPKYEVMGEFYRFLSDGLKDEPAWISLDMFGFVMEKKGTDDMRIGQRLADAVSSTDYVCPMMYPSHYPAGHLGFANPAEHPGVVIANGMEKGLHYFLNTRAKPRPWLQAFNMGAIYDAAKIRAQIDAAENNGADGWLLWNASNRYTAAGLNPD